MTDYIIVGAGSAGCVLAERLSRSDRNRVLLLEAGPPDSSLFIRMPKGMAKLYSNPKYMWFFETQGTEDIPAETWIRGRVIGGSSSVNGMMYFRGHPDDYDDWVKQGASGWDASTMLRAFREMEKHETPGETRGTDGLLGVSFPTRRTPLTDAFIRAGGELGVPVVDDLNYPGQEGVGYAPRTLIGGRRESAADAFLRVARKRSNLRIESGVRIDRILFREKRAVGVAGYRDNTPVTYDCEGEVIISCGTVQSPQILERSGIGNPDILSGLGIPLIHANKHVGEHLIEHRLAIIQYRLKRPESINSEFRGWRVLVNGLRYMIARSGPMADAPYEVAGFVRTDAAAARPDAEIAFAPYSINHTLEGELRTDDKHSCHIYGYPIRPTSEGSVHITSPDPSSPGAIRPNFLDADADCDTSIRTFRYMRRWMSQPSLRRIVGQEDSPGPTIESDEEILRFFRQQGKAGLHAIGTVRMGDDGVLDPHMRVRGVSGMRVVDGSAIPRMVSCNTNGPILALAWRAAELILASELRP